MTGKIVKALSGFYYIIHDGKLIECRASGLLRKRKETPLVGDNAEYELLPKDKGYVTEIKPRRNFLQRPPIANIDCMVIISSAQCPRPNLQIVDRMIAIAEKNQIEPIILFNKSDLENLDEYVDIYRKAGFEAYAVSCVTGEQIEHIRDLLKGKISLFCGNSGVGKSSLLNLLDDRFEIKTGEVSEKLGRGRHTTRHTQFYFLDEDTLIADSPGFSSIETERIAFILKEELPQLFREFSDYTGECRFNSCAHIKEKDCAVREAVLRGDIPKSRYDSYVSMYEESKDLKEWQLKK